MPTSGFARRAVALGVGALLALGVRAARGETPAGSAESSPTPAPSALPSERWEPSALPALNFDSDVGLGLGAVGALARFEPGFDPYRLRLEAQLFTSVAVDAAGTASLPFHDDYVRFDAPDLLSDRLRLAGGLFFRKLATSGYYGVGQLAPARVFSDAELERSEPARRYHQYDHLAVGADLTARITLLRVPRPGEDARLEWLAGAHGGYHDVSPYPGTELASDVARLESSADAHDPLTGLLHGVGPHGLLSTDAGLVWDDRDHEWWPTRGSLTELSSRWSAGVGERLRFARFHFSTRWFAPLFRDVVVFAHRTAVDAIAGDAPIYELTTFGVLEPADGPGGSKSVRGVALGRLAGKLKLIENAELRAQAPWFSIGEERFRVGFVAFVDAGRVFADVEPVPELDGPWAPFDVGVGGGLRLRWGETFVLRADGAWSPTRETPGVYVDIGQVF
ncbi:MAG TPA: BamA/TamA family outer membrane protein [Polyangiaceae bacterium]|jgi:hypothetical protein|nr:BamA/TamA family outer membrane protein [Polyangiaceae bacterium]